MPLTVLMKLQNVLYNAHDIYIYISDNDILFFPMISVQNILSWATVSNTQSVSEITERSGKHIKVSLSPLTIEFTYC